MNAPIRIALAAAALAALPAVATVTVSFPSAWYTDIGIGGSKEADDIKNELARYIHTLDEKYLKPEDSLWVDVIDVDLAGEPLSRGPRDRRVLRGGADFPVIVVRYRLDRGGKISSGEDRLREMGYFQSSLRINSSNESLYYEKRLLERWFRERFEK
jgi:hypothetical protein